MNALGVHFRDRTVAWNDGAALRNAAWTVEEREPKKMNFRYLSIGKTMKSVNFLKKWHRMVWGVVLLATLSLTACDNSDGYSLGDMAVDWVTVQRQSIDVCEFQGDRWGKLWPAVPDGRLQQLVNGQRMILTFNPLYDNFPEGYDCSIKVLEMRPVLTKQVEELTDENEEEFGNDPLRVAQDGMWIGGNCLNVIFAQPLPVEKKHRISLVRRAGTQVDAEGYLTLEMRYNTFDDTTDRWMESMVSYHLSSLLSTADAEGTPLKGIRVKVNAPDDGRKEWVLDFKKAVTQ